MPPPPVQPITAVVNAPSDSQHLLITQPDTDTPAVSHTPPAPPQIFVSGSGGVYTSSVFPLSANLDVRQKQEVDIISLEGVFTYEKLTKHKFEWDDKTETWLPIFGSFWKPSKLNEKATVDDFWTENRFGKDGKFSIKELDAKWGARWKRNKPALKTEGSRRMKVINIIERLSSNVNWNSTLAIRFLHEKYATQTKSGRAFSDYLSAKTAEDIMLASKSYP